MNLMSQLIRFIYKSLINRYGHLKLKDVIIANLYFSIFILIKYIFFIKMLLYIYYNNLKLMVISLITLLI